MPYSKQLQYEPIVDQDDEDNLIGMAEEIGVGMILGSLLSSDDNDSDVTVDKENNDDLFGGFGGGGAESKW